MKRLRVLSHVKVADNGQTIGEVQLIHQNVEDAADTVVIAVLTPAEAVQFGVYLIGAGSEAQSDSAVASYVMGAAVAGGEPREKAMQTAGKALEGVRTIRREGRNVVQAQSSTPEVH